MAEEQTNKNSNNKDPPPPVGHVSYPTTSSTAAPAPAPSPPPPAPAQTIAVASIQPRDPPIDHRKERLRLASRETDDEDEVEEANNNNINAADPIYHDNDENDHDNDGGLLESEIPPDPTGVYGPVLQAKYRRHLENSIVIPLPPRIIGGVRDQQERVKSCKCQRNNCLKLYCQCFSAGIYCSSYCDCHSACHNDGAPNHQYYRNKAIMTCLENNPHSFRSRTTISAGTASGPADTTTATTTKENNSNNNNKKQPTNTNKQQPDVMSCNCTKSKCLKKYCQCFNRGQYCKRHCNCVQCHNYKGNKERAQLSHVAQKLAGLQATRDALAKAEAATMKQKGGGASASASTATASTAKAGSKGNKATTTAASSSKVTTGTGNAPTALNKIKNSKSSNNNKNNVVQDDGYQPPSFYATPMKLPGGIDSASLAFGMASIGSRKRHAAETNAASLSSSEQINRNEPIDRAMATEEAILLARRSGDAGRNRSSPHQNQNHGAASPMTTAATNTTRHKLASHNNNNHHKRPKTQAAIQTELEHKWAIETQDVLGTFQAMRQELLERKRDAGLLGADIEITREYSYYDLVGSAQLAAVELDLADVMSSIKEAEATARKLARQEQASSTDSDEQMLLCDETMDNSNNSIAAPKKMDSKKREEITVELAQDAALMRELARIIRRHAQEMKEARTSTHPLNCTS